jgi:hypothetical protein
MESFWGFLRWLAFLPRSDASGKESMFNELHRDLKIILLVIFWAFLICLTGLVALALLQVFARGYVIVLWALATMAFGVLLGFLFGIPKVLQKNGAPDAAPAKIEAKDSGTPKSGYQLLVNTNLDDVSDWLTKIVLGVSLVELQRIPGLLTRLARTIADELNDPKLTSFVIAVIIYFAIMGFMLGYFATRLFVQRAFRIADLYSTVGAAGSVTVQEDTITVSAQSTRAVAARNETDKKSDG